MHSKTDNIKKTHDFTSDPATCPRPGQYTKMINSTKSRFTYGVTKVGHHVYASDQAFAMILLEPVRNLRWKSENGEELVSSYTAGTAFVIPAKRTMETCWTEPVEYLQVTIPTASNSVENERNSAADRSATAGSIVSFSSKQCLQVSQLVVEQLMEHDEEKQDYLASLHSVLAHLLQRNALTIRSSMVMPAGLSSYAARQIEAYLKDKFREPVSVPDMALALGISAGHFATRFRESFGQTPHQYLMSLRLDEAERWLRETDMPISTIAARLSFSSQSHLTTALRKYRRLTPGEIRRRSSHLRYRRP
ncbi:helix-turn-helix domain-containing protein [Brucella pituitosa]|uniref:helix-turn-helix domain-containing protein n=1 Tax=Brucella pituitosa TaxID=571256 RepID=UPI0026A70761